MSDEGTDDPFSVYEAPRDGAAALGGATSGVDTSLGVTFWPRVGARLLDHVFVFVFSFIAGMFAFTILAVTGRTYDEDGALQIVSFFFGIVYHVFFEGIAGATPAKMIFKMRVVQEDGSPCRLGSAFIRSLAYFWDGLFFGLIGYYEMAGNARCQRYGDSWAKTVVVPTEAIPAHLRQSGLALAGAGAIVIGALALIQVAANL